MPQARKALLRYWTQFPPHTFPCKSNIRFGNKRNPLPLRGLYQILTLKNARPLLSTNENKCIYPACIWVQLILQVKYNGRDFVRTLNLSAIFARTAGTRSGLRRLFYNSTNLISSEWYIVDPQLSDCTIKQSSITDLYSHSNCRIIGRDSIACSNILDFGQYSIDVNGVDTCVTVVCCSYMVPSPLLQR